MLEVVVSKQVLGFLVIISTRFAHQSLRKLVESHERDVLAQASAKPKESQVSFPAEEEEVPD